MNLKKIQLKSIVVAFAAVAVTVVGINQLSFLFTYFSLGFPEITQFKFDNGLFWLNGERIGMGFEEPKYRAFYVFLFLVWAVRYSKDDGVFNNVNGAAA